MGQFPKEQPEYVFGKKNRFYEPQPASQDLVTHSRGNWDNRKEDYLKSLREEFITDQPYSPEKDAIDSFRDREPDEVPDFPEGVVNEAVLGEYARHAISSAYARSGRQQPDDQEDNPPVGSDGGRVVTAEGKVAGYGWVDEDGKITSLISLDGTVVYGPGHEDPDEGGE